MTALRDRRLQAFSAFALAVLFVEWIVSRTAAFFRGGAVPVAIFVDLMVVLPLAYALVVLRGRGRSWLEVAPVVALAAIAAGVLLSSRPETKALLRIGGAVAEGTVLALLVRRVRAASAQLRGAEKDDLLQWVAAVSDPVLRLLGVELVVAYYAFVGPRVRRPLQRGEFSYTEKSGAGGLLFALGLVMAIEGVALHFLLRSYSPRASWVLAALNVYGLVWLFAAYQAARLRPVALSAERLLVRTSLLWTADVPRDAIASVAPLAPSHEMPRGARETVLRAAFGTAPVLLLSLAAPVVARGPFGIQRRVTGIALYVDEPEELARALTPSVRPSPRP